jgi:uncharacterized protein (DUF433 family)
METSPSRDGASAAEDPYVAEYPGVCGGYPVLRNTRIPVRTIVGVHRRGVGVDELAELYGIAKERIQGALDYYAAHPERVDEDFERNQRSWAELIERNVQIQGRPWPG